MFLGRKGGRIGKEWRRRESSVDPHFHMRLSATNAAATAAEADAGENGKGVGYGNENETEEVGRMVTVEVSSLDWIIFHMGIGPVDPDTSKDEPNNDEDAEKRFEKTNEQGTSPVLEISETIGEVDGTSDESTTAGNDEPNGNVAVDLTILFVQRTDDYHKNGDDVQQSQHNCGGDCIGDEIDGLVDELRQARRRVDTTKLAEELIVGGRSIVARLGLVVGGRLFRRSGGKGRICRHWRISFPGRHET